MGLARWSPKLILGVTWRMQAGFRKKEGDYGDRMERLWYRSKAIEIDVVTMNEIGPVSSFSFMVGVDSNSHLFSLNLPKADVDEHRITGHRFTSFWA